MKKINVIRLISFSLALTFVVLGMFIKEKSRANKYKSQIYKQQEESFVNLKTEFEKITLDLEKMIYLSSYDQLNDMSNQIISKSRIIRTELMQLGCKQELTVINDFLTQIEVYSQYLKEIDLSIPSEIQENSVKLSKLMENSKNICELLNSISNEKPQNIVNDLSGAFGKSDLQDSTENFSFEYENDNLNFKGPFANHITKNSQWEFVISKEKIEMEQALELAEEFSHSNGNLSFDKLVEDIISVYIFSNEYVEVGISVNGGFLVYMKKRRSSSDNYVTESRAVEFSDTFVTKCGFNNLVETYHYKEDGVIKVNYAYLDGETVCYADLITVSVAADNGEILSMETYGYLANHKERTIPSPLHSAEYAKTILNEKLKVTSYINVLIPTSNGQETRCYGFYCEGVDLRKILIYINAQTLNEEGIILFE